MSTQVKAIPQGYHSLTPYLIVKNAARAIDFYKEAFGAQELFRMEAPEGKIGHCELKIGDSRLMLADEFPHMGSTAPSEADRGFSLLLYVENVDDIFKRARGAGAKVIQAVKDEFWGDRMGTLEDPFGHRWNLGSHVEDVSPEEMKRRQQKMFS